MYNRPKRRRLSIGASIAQFRHEQHVANPGLMLREQQRQTRENDYLAAMRIAQISIGRERFIRETAAARRAKARPTT